MDRRTAWSTRRSVLLAEESRGDVDHRVDVLFETEPQRQAHQTVRDIVGHRQRAIGVPQLSTLGRRMQRYVVKYALDFALLHVVDEPGALVEILQEQVVHMRVEAAIVGHDRSAQPPVPLKTGKGIVVALP